MNSEDKARQSLEAFEARAEVSENERYVLRLYICGTTQNSMRAVANVKKICEEHLGGRYDLEIIDVYQHPALAEGEQIIAAPTLIKKLPYPLKKIIGNMANTKKVLLGLDLRPRDGGG